MTFLHSLLVPKCEPLDTETHTCTTDERSMNSGAERLSGRCMLPILLSSDELILVVIVSTSIEVVFYLGLLELDRNRGDVWYV